MDRCFRRSSSDSDHHSAATIATTSLNYAAFSFDKPPLALRSLVGRVPVVDATLGEGDVLYLPALWWHEVTALPDPPGPAARGCWGISHQFEPFFARRSTGAGAGAGAGAGGRGGGAASGGGSEGSQGSGGAAAASTVSTAPPPNKATTTAAATTTTATTAAMMTVPAVNELPGDLGPIVLNPAYRHLHRELDILGGFDKAKGPLVSTLAAHRSEVVTGANQDDSDSDSD